MKVLDLVQGSQEWLDYRRTRVTATDAAVVMGVDPWDTPFQRWQQKLGLVGDKFVHFGMARGNALESVAREAYGSISGVPSMPTCVEHDSLPFMASLDGISIDYDRLVEIKNLADWDINSVPENYWVQMQFQLLCSDIKEGDFFSYSGKGKVGKLFSVAIDGSYQQRLIEACLHFHHCCLSGKPPPLTERDCVPRDDVPYHVAASHWMEAKKLLDEAIEREKQAREELKALSNDRSTEGFGVRVRKIVQPGGVDYKSIPELSGVDLEKYRKPPIVKWVITNRGDKDV